MSLKNEIICDRCGATYPLDLKKKSVFSLQEAVHKECYGEPDIEEDHDLCVKCEISFRHWFGEGKKK